MPTPWDEPEDQEPADTTCGWACQMEEEERKRKLANWETPSEPEEDYPW